MGALIVLLVVIARRAEAQAKETQVAAAAERSRQDDERRRQARLARQSLDQQATGLRAQADAAAVALREKQLVAPKDGMLTSMVSETVGSIGREIDEAKARIAANREEIATTKLGVREALRKNGVELTAEQVDLLLDGVLSGDLVRLVVVFNAAKLIDGQLGKLMTASGENVGAARKYFAMHAALFALLVHAQDSLIGKIDRQYLPKLATIEIDIRNARAKTAGSSINPEKVCRSLETSAETRRPRYRSWPV